nr:alginate lyase [uncultured bacterium]
MGKSFFRLDSTGMFRNLQPLALLLSVLVSGALASVRTVRISGWDQEERRDQPSVLIPFAYANGTDLSADLCAAGNEAPVQSTDGPARVFLFDAKKLELARRQLRAGDKSLAPALARLEREAQKDPLEFSLN